MLMIDVMRRLNSENEIRFLLTAYIETLQFYDSAKRLPLGVATLPLGDVDDIEARFTELLGAELCGLARSHCDTQGAIAREATEIFGAAFTRLQTLRQSAPSPVPRLMPALHFSRA
ncbi:MAG: hypothetical protein ABL891_03970 [Burkholderiales bacterium]